VRRNGVLYKPDPKQVLSADDMLLIVSDDRAIDKLSREV